MVDPFQFLYRLLLRFDQRRRAAHPFRPPIPVISIGGLSTGGVGKTPVVIAVGEILEEAGYHPIVLTRGYRSRLEKGYGLLCSGEEADPDLFGDEPTMVAAHLQQSCVVVGRRRKENLMRFLRERVASIDTFVVLLDDGFQHLQIERDLDIVVVDETTLRSGKLLPTGDLREPVESLERADVIMLPVGAADPHPVDFDTRFIRFEERTFPPRSVVDDSDMASGTGRALLVTGIARPGRVVESIRRRGIEIVRHLEYRDHHRYIESDATNILTVARSVGADAIITTGKDYVKLRMFPQLLPTLYVIPHRIVPTDPGAFRAIILDGISKSTDQLQ